jgi:hypothetical protein
MPSVRIGSNEDLLDGSEDGGIQLVLAHLRPDPALEFMPHHWPIKDVEQAHVEPGLETHTGRELPPAADAMKRAGQRLVDELFDRRFPRHKGGRIIGWPFFLDDLVSRIEGDRDISAVNIEQDIASRHLRHSGWTGWPCVQEPAHPPRVCATADCTTDNKFIARHYCQPATRLQDIAETQGPSMGYVIHSTAVMWFHE